MRPDLYKGYSGAEGRKKPEMMCEFRVVSEDHGWDREGIAFCEDDDDDTHE